jgi:hypothetical protein
MGTIYDRTLEHLGTTDAMVIQTRRLLLQAARALQSSGTVPAAVTHPEMYRAYGGSANVPKGENGLDFCRATLFGEAAQAQVATTRS